MSEDRCDCCDLPVYSCGKAIEQQARQKRETTGPTIEAKFAGKCPSCGDWITVGTPITATAEGWVCCP